MNTEIDTDQDMLKRIVALLFALAAMAERAAGRSHPVRCLVLWILRRAEVAVRRWVDWDELPTGDEPVLQRNSAADAMQLARTFRALADAFQDYLRLYSQWRRRRSDNASDEAHDASAGSIRRLCASLAGLLALEAPLRLGASCRGPPRQA